MKANMYRGVLVRLGLVIGWGVGALGAPDANAESADCNGNGVSDCDELWIFGGSIDCNANGIPDECDLGSGVLEDLNLNGLGDACESPVLFVKEAVETPGNGLSWAQAYPSLEQALRHAALQHAGVEQIWVAMGTYVPTRRTVEDDPRTATFQLVDGVALLGGFAGDEVHAAQRDPDANSTILCGDVLGNDGPSFSNRSDNVYHVVRASDTRVTTTVDGFTIRGGHVNIPGEHNLGGGMLVEKGLITLRECTFTDNWAGDESDLTTADELGTVATTNRGGGGLNIANAGLPDVRRGISLIESCRFIANATSSSCGGLSLHYAEADVVGCAFEDNEARGGGGGACALAHGSWRSRPPVIEDTLFRRNAAEYGGGLWAATFSGYIEIRACTFEENSASSGGGLHFDYTVEGSSISDCTFRNNTAEYFGGGMRSSFSNFTRIEGCAFHGNQAPDGGAVYVPGSETEIHGCEFEQNHALRGGSIFASYGPTYIEECAFRWNGADRAGGAIYGAPDLRLDRCVLNGNYAPRGGAIAGFDGAIERARFEDNFADYGGAIDATGPLSVRRSSLVRNRAFLGGAVSALQAHGPVDLHSCLLVGNNAIAHGGGIAAGVGDVIVDGCTIVQNSAGALGGGIFGGRYSEIRSSILWGNIADSSGHALVDQFAQYSSSLDSLVEYSTIQGLGLQADELNNSGLDPMFIDTIGLDGVPLTGDEDYRLHGDSPALNSGDPSYTWPDAGADLDGHARVLCGRVDRGAYEVGIGDPNCDGIIEREELIGAFACMSGPEVTADAACAPFDYLGDGAIDLEDVARLQVDLNSR